MESSVESWKHCHSERSEESQNMPSLRENERSEFSWQSKHLSSLRVLAKGKAK